MTVKIGAAAWITAVSPESRRVSAKPSSQNGIALLNAPRTAIGTRRPRSGARSPRPGSRASRTRTPKTTRPSATTDGSSASTPTLMNRNDAPEIEESRSRRSASRRVTVRNVNAAGAVAA